MLLSVILGAQDREIIQRRLGFRRVGRLGRQVFDGQMALTILDHDGRQTHERAVEIQFNLGQVEGIKAQFEGAPRIRGSDLVTIALQGQGGIAADLAFLAPEKGAAHGFGIGVANLVESSGVACPGTLVGFTVLVPVIDTLEPRPERHVEFRQGRDVRWLNFGQELQTQRFEKALLFAFGFRRVGGSLDALDAQGSTRGIELHR